MAREKQQEQPRKRSRERAGAWLSIGALAKAAGVSVQTVRWYEQQGLLPEPLRTAGGQRRYGRETLQRLSFIRHARELGLPLADIRALLQLADNPAAPCAEADEIIRRNLKSVRRRIAWLQALEGEFERMLRECPSGEVRNCRVLEILSDHELCENEHPMPPEERSR